MTRPQQQTIAPDPITGEPDDVFITCDYFRMEQMDDDSWWLAVYRGDKRVCFSLYRDKKKVRAVVTEDDFGCTP